MTTTLQAICDDDEWLYAPLHCSYKHWSRDELSSCLKGKERDGRAAVRVTVLGHSLERTNYYDLMYWLIGARARDLGLHGGPGGGGGAAAAASGLVAVGAVIF